MGRGGNKKKKQAGNDKVETQDLRDSESSTSIQASAVPASEEPKPGGSVQSKPAEGKEVSKKLETPAAQSKEEEQERESVGLGLDLEDRKKKPRRKKKNASDAQSQSQQKPLETAVPEYSAKSLPVETQEVSTQLEPVVSQPLFPSLPPSGTQGFPELAERGRGRGIGQGEHSIWSAPQQLLSGGTPRHPGQQLPGQQQPGLQHPGQQQPGQQHPRQQHPWQQHPGQQQPGLQHPGQQQPGQQHPGQQHPRQQHPRQQHPGQQHPRQQHPGQQHPGQQQPGQQHPGQQQPGQQQPGQQHPGQQHPGQQHPGQQHPGQQHPGQQHPGQQLPGQQQPGQQHPGQQHPRQQHPRQQHPGQQHPRQQHPGQQHPGQQQPGQQHPGQQQPGQQQPGQQHPGQQHPGQQHPGQQHPGQQHPGQQLPGQQHPGQQHPGQQQQPHSVPQGTTIGQLSTSGRSPSVASSSSTKSFEGAICRFKIPSKIDGFSVPARKLKLLTNYLEMKIKDIKVYRYDVSIKPDRPKKLTPKAFDVAKSIHFPKSVTAYDQRKNCYALSPLWDPSKDRITYNVEILDDNKAKMPFEVTLKATGIVDLSTITNHIKSGGSSLNTPSEAIQCIDVILQQGTLQNYVKVGRQYFKRPSKPIDLGFGLEMWTGLFQSAIFTSRPFINIDVAHKGFPRSQSLLNALIKDFQLKPNAPLEQQRGFNIELFHQFIKGLRVKAFVGGDSRSGKLREYICNEVVDPPNKLMFTMEQNGKTIKMSVEKYFLTEKKLRLQYPNLNCMWVGPRNKNIYYPIELLEISHGQALNRQLNERQLQTMVREAATPPNERLNKIKEVIRDMNYSANPMFKHFKLEIGNEFFKVDAKVLEAPKLNVGTGRFVAPRNGSWQANRFLKPSALDTWGLIAVDADPNACRCEDLIQNIKRTARQMGMVVNDPLYFNFNVRALDLKKTLCIALDKRVNFMFIIVGGRDRNCYHKVKRIAELEVGMLTQCIKEFTAKVRMNDQTVRNILLKVNSKLNGVNQALDAMSVPKCIREGGVMMVGADVTHPSPDQVSVPSIAAVTASYDTQCFMYNIELSVQTPKAEIIVEFEDMMFDHLIVYRKHQRSLPRKIYVFRDGVSEGQFSQVMNSELVAIQNAYSRLEKQRKPEILFLLVQKRHHTRFFLGENERYNVEPGTVVDTEIVHRSELDFYLVSHAAIKGTARPTRYHAVANDGRVPSDEVEQLTFYLCHLYSRCMRSVSYPTPTYYAHLACLRARSLTFGDQFNNSDLERKPKRLRVMDKILDLSRMFFV